MLQLVFVMCGGAIGAGLRFAVSQVLSPAGFPWNTLAVNLLGGLAMGVLAGAVDRQVQLGLWLFAGVGVLGGFTTFSAFSLESWRMMAAGHFTALLSYVALSVIGSVALTAFGFWAVRR